MTIPATCPECMADWNLPDSLAGKTVKCKDCGARMEVPGGKRVSQREEDEDEEETPRSRGKRGWDEDDRPRQRKKRQSKGLSLWVTIGIPVGGLLVIGVVGLVIVLSRGSKDTASRGTAQDPASNTGGTESEKPEKKGKTSVMNSAARFAAAKRNPPPQGWSEFRHPEGYYSVYVPNSPPGMVLREKFAGKGETYDAQSPFKHQLGCVVSYYKASERWIADFQQDIAMVHFPTAGVSETATRSTWDGHPVAELTQDTIYINVSIIFPKVPRPDKEIFDEIPIQTKQRKYRYYERRVLLKDLVFTFTIMDLTGVPSEEDRRTFFESIVFGF